jgi:hypothetical protein
MNDPEVPGGTRQAAIRLARRGRLSAAMAPRPCRRTIHGPYRGAAAGTQVALPEINARPLDAPVVSASTSPVRNAMLSNLPTSEIVARDFHPAPPQG